MTAKSNYTKWDGQENEEEHGSDMEYPDEPVIPAKKSKRLNDDNFIINEHLEEKVECYEEDSKSPKYNTNDARACTGGI
jgi:hypothetical protein